MRDLYCPHNLAKLGCLFSECLYWTARVCFEQGHYADAERLWREELEGRREVNGNDDLETINVTQFSSFCSHSDYF